MFKVEIHKENDYYRLHVSHPLHKGRIRRRLGNRLDTDQDLLKSIIKTELHKSFSDVSFTLDQVDAFIEKYISMSIKHNSSIFEFKAEFLLNKSKTKNKRTRVCLSKSTLSGYRTALHYFEAFLDKNKIAPHPSSITESVFNDFYDYIPGKHNYKVKVHTKVKGFLKFLESEKNLPLDPSYKKSVFTEEYDNQCPSDKDRALTIEQVKQLIKLKEDLKHGSARLDNYVTNSSFPESVRIDQYNLRNVNLVKSLDCFLLMISAGMYYADITKSQIFFSTNGSLQHQRYRRAKNNTLCKAIPVKNDGIFIGAQIIKDYDIKNGSNFPLNMSLTHFNRHLDRISKLAGLDFKITNKMARKTFASILYFDKKMPINLIMTLLGHKDVSKTMHYLRITDDSLASEISRYM